MKTVKQTVRITIEVPDRNEGAPPVPVILATRAIVILDGDGKAIGRVAGSDETRVLANVTEIPEFPAFHAVLAAAIEATFNPSPAPEPELEQP